MRARAFLVVIGVLWTTGSVAAQGLLERVEALERQAALLAGQLAALTDGSLTMDVDCAAGQTIQAALAKGQSFLGDLVIINVFGACTENVTVTRKALIRAGAPGAAIAAADPRLPVIRNVNPGVGSGYLVLADLTISGGQVGVLVNHGRAVQVTRCTITGNQTGITASNQALLRLEHSFVEGNTGGGVSVRNGAHLLMTGGAIRNNTGNGLDVHMGATGEVFRAVIASNGGDGALILAGSVLALEAATMSDNAFAGVTARGGSTVWLGKATVVTKNGQSGIQLIDNSVVEKGRGEADIHITNNSRWGVGCSPPPAAAIMSGFTQPADISGNLLGDINCPMSPGPP